MNVLHFLMAYAQTVFNMASIKRDERGVSALEYALIASLIGLAIIASVKLYGTNLNRFFGRAATSVASL